MCSNLQRVQMKLYSQCRPITSINLYQSWKIHPLPVGYALNNFHLTQICYDTNKPIHQPPINAHSVKRGLVDQGLVDQTFYKTM